MKDLTKNEMLRLGSSGLRLFFSLSEKWELSESDQALLLGTSINDLPKLRNAITRQNPEPLTMELIERLSLIAGIQKNLEMLYPPDQVALYIKSKNSKFNGLSLLECMLEGGIAKLREVRIYLDSCCGAHYL